MNYIRGAVSAISAPYQYYRDLPPINPSTLTGAIDVIVIQRPTDNDGATELACSPFHVRFGKWQVLRPGEKKVNVFVNGKPIPFNMKIGEAGEAFFVFETDDDVPADLITSPILQPTIPVDALNKPPEELGRLPGKEEKDTISEVRIEPDFLDLDAGSRNVDKDIRTTPRQTYTVPKPLRRNSSRATIMPSPSFSFYHPAPGSLGERSHTPVMVEQDQRVDAALKNLANEAHVPQVEYHPDVTLDMEGYKSSYHDRERSDQTVTSSNQYRFLRQHNPSDSHSSLTDPSLAQTQSASHSPYAPSPTSSLSPSPSSSTSPTSSPCPPLLRATSEPPPDMDLLNDTNSQPQPSLPQIQEYSWEWGAFPQPSTIKASFSKGGRIESNKALWGTGRKGRTNTVKKSRLGGMTLPPIMKPISDQNQGQDEEGLDREGLPGRSRSVPPLLEGDLSRKGRRASRELKEYEDADAHLWPEYQGNIDFSLDADNQRGEAVIFGIGGALNASEDDPTTLVLSIDGRKLEFQLSLVGDHNTLKRRGRGEMEAARLFDSARIDLIKLLEDEDVVRDPRLVIRWARDQYITRDDGSPLLDALVHWRTTTLRKRASEGFLQPPTTQRHQQRESVADHIRSQSEPPSVAEMRKMEGEDKTEAMAAAGGRKGGDAVSLGTNSTGATKKPTSSSWVQWWGRGRKKISQDTKAKDTTKNVEKVYGVLDINTDSSSSSLPLPPGFESILMDGGKPVLNESFPSAPSRHPVPSTTKVSDQATRHTLSAVTAKKFAKTLRLTSDQLKALNLRPGANTITFSLSATGAVAATARIFVWDSTDLVVVSDIDGTITKSDGLGHVFAMIGRDWTHVGVAKLYTDIARNGYKIMYLTSRAIGQADATRDYLKGIKQNDYQLPEGPVIMSPDRLMASLHREVIMRKPEVFKMACLRDIQRLFGESARNPFYAGFGNRITDALSYRSVNVPSARIFTIDSSGEVKMELLELAGYKSSYIHMTDLVDQMFPPIHRKWTPEFTDFNYWKVPLREYTLPDLFPPSPTLSARSDTSNQSALARLRNFSLGGNSTRGGHVSPKHPSSAEGTDHVGSYDSSQAYRDSHLRQMSSFEKLSSTLGFMRGINNGGESRRSASPALSSSYAGSDDEDGDEGELDVDGRPRMRRPRSMTSMPGALDEMHFDMDEEGEGEGHNEYDDEDGYDGDENSAEEMEEEFDDDLLVAGAMQKVPFLYE